MANNSPIIDVQDLSIEFSQGHSHYKRVVKNASFSVKKEEILAIVGESGSGKSVTCMGLTRLLPSHNVRYPAGTITFENNDLLKASEKELRSVRGGKIAYIFQDPTVSLNPVIRVGKQIEETLKLHRPDVKDRKQEIISLLDQVGIPEPHKRLKSYPHEMSGGMQQRVMIAMALACRPQLLIADEPTTALDVTIQAQILDLINELRTQTEMGVLLITHNMGVVSKIADRVIVMYDGTILEEAPTRELINNPIHPYTRALLKAVPKMGERLAPLDSIPDMDDDIYSSGRDFAWTPVSEEHFVRDWN